VRGEPSGGAARDTWKSASEHGPITSGTLFHEAKANGWHDDNAHQRPTAEEAAERRRLAAARAEAAEVETTRRRAAASAKAGEIWEEATPDPEDHAYLRAKDVKAHGIRLHKGALVVPMRADGSLCSLQFIDADGGKKFLTGGRVTGCYHSVGKLEGAAGLAIVEGYATGATVHEATGLPVAVAFNAGNIKAVAVAMRAKFPGLPLVLCADDDRQTEGNPGLTKAREAARAVGGAVAVPDFGPDRPPDASDMNDLARLQGPEAVRECIAAALASPHDQATDTAEGAEAPGDRDDPGPEDANCSKNSNCNSSKAEKWPESQPITAKIDPEPYPASAMPQSIRAAVEEVQGFTKAPLAMVASAALAAVSVAIQGHFDVRRADLLQGPTGLYMLTIADSGERKTTCDGFFATAIRDYQDEQFEAAKPAQKEHAAAESAWEAKSSGVKEKIRQLAKSGKCTKEAEGRLVSLEHDRPNPPRVPRLLYSDATPEALAFSLAKRWPSGGVVSSEGGLVFGSHGMGKDSVMRNLALLNQLWDGATLTIDRRSTESFTVRGARLTVALQVQEPILREFFAKSGTLARGSGFLARFLVAWPASTQGFRPFTEAPTGCPSLAAFHHRLAGILDQPVPMDEDGALTPAMMTLAPAAKLAWVRFHDVIEGRLASGGELHDVRDVASKTADNAARLAALFQVFEYGPGGVVGLEAFESASRIVAWHLSESKRFFGELALPVEMSDAVRLDAWLIAHCRRERTLTVGKNYALQHGPLQVSSALNDAIRKLVDLDRLRLVKDGRRLLIDLNPGILEVPHVAA
jgi:putative DNA primase/helicase